MPVLKVMVMFHKTASTHEVSENVADTQLTINFMKNKPSGKGEGEGLIVTTCTTGFSLFCVILAVDICCK